MALMLPLVFRNQYVSVRRFVADSPCPLPRWAVPDAVDLRGLWFQTFLIPICLGLPFAAERLLVGLGRHGLQCLMVFMAVCMLCYCCCCCCSGRDGALVLNVGKSEYLMVGILECLVTCC